ncbi:MAG TPA: M67 family metallopeptidase [Thermoplasmata archaeon]|nr:M67 family metallopeptidase [Thermoplasmata archaeon]
MRPIEIRGSVLRSIAEHARTTYPDECCGFLIAPPDPPGDGSVRSIVDAQPAGNEFEGERRRRFLLRPEDLRATERRLDGTGLMVAGFYHSHPDHPARPSEFDQDHAWPWYTYLVIGVTRHGIGEARAFELDSESSEFREVPVRRAIGANRGRPVVPTYGRG